MKYAWIDAQRHGFGLDEMCAVLDVSESGYRSWKRGGKPQRKRLTDAQMLNIPLKFSSLILNFLPGFRIFYPV